MKKYGFQNNVFYNKILLKMKSKAKAQKRKSAKVQKWKIDLTFVKMGFSY